MKKIEEQLKNWEANLGKNLLIDVDGVNYARLPVKTHVITAQDDIFKIFEQYALPHLIPNDIVFLSERIVAITQGRAFPIKNIKPSWLAKFLVKFVHKSPYGIGLGSPWTMELAIREAGILRILFAAFVSAITKPFGIKGLFYIIAGKSIAAIDGPCHYTLPPYNEYAKLGPKNPGKLARRIKERFGYDVVIIDANDLGVSVLGKSSKKISENFCKKVFRDNPLGQSSQQTPIGIVRKVE
jgi:F420-0:gamma-glutamyl ligase-like protein|uniref:F420-0--gamma-glutamyl ligase n=1 Tax=candidate division WOR-3 bacterium TaxID=2052148 RepID=A0A7V3RIA6_UNCW3